MSEADWRRGLVDLARAVGVEPEYHDTGGVLHHASDETLLAVLGTWGLPVERLADVPAGWEWWHRRTAGTTIEPVLAPRHGHPIGFRLRQPAGGSTRRLAATLQLEDGARVDLGAVQLGEPERHRHGTIETDEWWIELGADRPDGYHRLCLEVGDDVVASTVVSAPATVRGFAPDECTWGAFAPMYSLRGRADFGDFDRLATWLDSYGGSVLATLPVLATFLDTPFAPSPYTPVSRRFWNELFLDLDRLSRSVTGRAVDESRWSHLDEPGPYDYRAHAAAVHDVLAQLVTADPDLSGPGLGSSSPMPDADRYATFRAVGAQQGGASWHEWPDRLRRGEVQPGDYDPAVAQLHALGQHAAREQLLALSASLRDRGQRLYLDLPIGAHPDGFDTWHEAGLFALGASTGAPPDDFFTGGQNWGFPPILPDASRQSQHAHFRDCLRHHMEIAGVLRLDHVMGLHRLYWVPDGRAATDGAYVRYPRDELFAVLALESHRHDCIVVGEDLGTVPDEVRTAMADHEVLGMYVSEFMLPDHEADIARPVHRSVASVDTHDTPTFAAFTHGLDVSQRVDMGLLDVDDAHHEFDARRSQIDNLRRVLRDHGLVDPTADDHALLVGVLRFLGGSAASCVLVALEDLWGEVHPQNVPGTPADRPNWVQRFPFDLDELADLPRVKVALDALDRSRKEAVS